MEFSDPDLAWSTNGLRPPIPFSLPTLEVRSRSSLAGEFAVDVLCSRVSPVVKFAGDVRPMSSCQIRSLYKTYGP
ncbi:unnamed protein product, partial [Sphagnum compactum]